MADISTTWFISCPMELVIISRYDDIVIDKILKETEVNMRQGENKGNTFISTVRISEIET